MNETTTGNGDGSGVGAVAAATAISEPPREKLTKKAITADHPTWCPGCGDFAVLASFYKVLEKRQSRARKDRHPRRDRLFIALSIFRQRPRRALHSRPRGPARLRHQPRPARSPRVPVRRRRRRLLDRRQPSRSRRTQEHQHDLFHHGQLRLWADEETDLADLADRIQVEDGPHRRNRSAGQSDEEINRRRRNIHRAHARRAGTSHDSTDRARDSITRASASSNA